MDTDFDDILLTHLMTGSALIVIFMNDQGYMTRASFRAEHLAGKPLAGCHFSELLLDFAQTPGIHQLGVNPDAVHLLHLKNRGGLPDTCYFRFWRRADRILGIGQHDVQEMDTLRQDMVVLNNELNTMTRSLHQQNIRLDRLNRQKNQFFGMASHDLRHPLKVMTLYAGFLADEAADRLSEEHQEFLVHIQEAGQNLAQILNDFLDISLMETGQMSVNLTDLDAVSWLNSVLKRLQAVARRKQISIRRDTPSHPITVCMDGNRMEQVVTNLVDNAVKFSPPGGRVRVSLYRQDAAVILSVSDNGPGIAPEDRERIFMPFERLKSGIPRAEKSSGLGLAIVQKIVHAHQGRVLVESQPGHGATFRVSLPQKPCQ